MKNAKSYHYIPVLVMGILLQLWSNAQGNLMITPKRVIFEGAKLNETVNLVNSGKDTALYSISFVHYKMKEDGSFEEVPKSEPGILSAEPYVRFFPRTVTLAPGEAQVIRLQFMKPEHFPTGEFRSHLYIRSNPKPVALGAEKTQENKSGIGVKLTPIFGLSIPVIIRSGETNASMNLSNLTLSSADQKSFLDLHLNRSGNMSIYGDFQVSYVDGKGKSTVIAEAKGVAVYAPNPHRQIHFALNTSDAINLHNGKIHVKFETRSTPEGKEAKYTEADLLLQ